MYAHNFSKIDVSQIVSLVCESTKIGSKKDFDELFFKINKYLKTQVPQFSYAIYYDIYSVNKNNKPIVVNYSSNSDVKFKSFLEKKLNMEMMQVIHTFGEEKRHLSNYYDPMLVQFYSPNPTGNNLYNSLYHAIEYPNDINRTLVISLITNEIPVPMFCANVVDYLAPFIHKSYLNVLKKEKILSPREVETLGWVKDGKNTWEISVILNISERTVKYHIKNIFEKLDVVSRPQAVARAIQYGLIA